MNKKTGVGIAFLVLIILIIFALFQSGIFDEFITSTKLQQLINGQLETTTTIARGGGGPASDYVTNPANPLESIQFNKDYPLKMDFIELDKVLLSFILAPRVEND